MYKYHLRSSILMLINDRYATAFSAYGDHCWAVRVHQEWDSLRKWYHRLAFVESSQPIKQHWTIVRHNRDVCLNSYGRFLLAKNVSIWKLSNHKMKRFREHHVLLKDHNPGLCVLWVPRVHIQALHVDYSIFVTIKTVSNEYISTPFEQHFPFRII